MHDFELANRKGVLFREQQGGKDGWQVSFSLYF
jgi:hypothetical protein